MHKFEQHYREVRAVLTSLIVIFDSSETGEKYRSFFSELVEANELELALHAVCDFLLESSAQSINISVIDEIDFLHKKMAIDDSCLVKLKAHCLKNSGL